MKRRNLTPAAEAAILWITGLWRPGIRKEVLRQYSAAREDLPLMVADLARVCCAFDSTIGATPEQTLILTGKREVWLDFCAKANLSPDDLGAIEQETDRD